MRALHRQERLGVGHIVGERLDGHVGKLVHHAASQRGGAQVGGRRVVGAAREPRHRELGDVQRVGKIARPLGQDDGIAHRHLGVHDDVLAEHALARLVGPIALGEHQAVDVVGIVRSGRLPVGDIARTRRVHIERMDAHDVLAAVDLGDRIGLVGGHDRLDALDRAQLADLRIGEPQRRHDADVHEVGAVEVLIGRDLHIRRRHAQTGIEPGPERGDDRDGDEPPHRLTNRPPNLLVKRASHRSFLLSGSPCPQMIPQQKSTPQMQGAFRFEQRTAAALSLGGRVRAQYPHGQQSSGLLTTLFPPERASSEPSVIAQIETTGRS